jgi:hypothetical protein
VSAACRRQSPTGSTRARGQARTEDAIFACTTQTCPTLVQSSIQAGFEIFQSSICFPKDLTFCAQRACDEGCWPDLCDEKDGLAALCACQELSPAPKVRPRSVCARTQFAPSLHYLGASLMPLVICFEAALYRRWRSQARLQEAQRQGNPGCLRESQVHRDYPRARWRCSSLSFDRPSVLSSAASAVLRLRPFYAVNRVRVVTPIELDVLPGCVCRVDVCRCALPCSAACAWPLAARAAARCRVPARTPVQWCVLCVSAARPSRISSSKKSLLYGERHPTPRRGAARRARPPGRLAADRPRPGRPDSRPAGARRRRRPPRAAGGPCLVRRAGRSARRRGCHSVARLN